MAERHDVASLVRLIAWLWGIGHWCPRCTVLMECSLQRMLCFFTSINERWKMYFGYHNGSNAGLLRQIWIHDRLDLILLMSTYQNLTS